MAEMTSKIDFDGLADDDDRRLWDRKERQLQKKLESLEVKNRELRAQGYRTPAERMFDDYWAGLSDDERKREQQNNAREDAARKREEEERRRFAEALGPEFTTPWNRLLKVPILLKRKREAEKAVRRFAKSIESRPLQYLNRALRELEILLGPYEFRSENQNIYLCGIVHFHERLPPRRLAVRIPLAPRQRDVFVETFRPGQVGRANHAKLKLKSPDDLREIKARILQKIQETVGPVPMPTVRNMLRIEQKKLIVHSSSEQTAKRS